MVLRCHDPASAPLAATGRLECLELTYDAARRHYVEASPPKLEKSLKRCVNRRNTYGQTPLMMACKHGQARVVSWLLSKGADPMLFDSIHSRACLHYCALYGQSACVVRASARLTRDTILSNNNTTDCYAATFFCSTKLCGHEAKLHSVVALCKWGSGL